MFALMDFDPDGIAIMSTYKHGSVALRHEKASLRIPQLKWLGVKSTDINPNYSTSLSRVWMTQDPAERKNSEQASPEGVLRLTRRDRRKANRMLEKAQVQEERGWTRELQVMLMLNIKVEIQILSSRTGGLESWLERRLSEALRS